MPPSLQYLHRHGFGSSTSPHHLEPQTETPSTAICDWHSQSGITICKLVWAFKLPRLRLLTINNVALQRRPNVHSQSRLHAHVRWRSRQHLGLLGSFLAKVSFGLERYPIGAHTARAARRPGSLQLNIGIAAACASFLKPLVGRLLKINSSVAYSHPPNSYNRGGRTPGDDVEGIGGKYYAASNRGADRSDVDEVELQTKNDVGAGDHRVMTKIQAPRTHVASPDFSSAEAVDAVPSDANSEDMILPLQKHREGNSGIVITRDITVRYSNK